MTVIIKLFAVIMILKNLGVRGIVEILAAPGVAVAELFGVDTKMPAIASAVLITWQFLCWDGSVTGAIEAVVIVASFIVVTAVATKLLMRK